MITYSAFLLSVEDVENILTASTDQGHVSLFRKSIDENFYCAKNRAGEFSAAAIDAVLAKHLGVKKVVHYLADYKQIVAIVLEK